MKTKKKVLILLVLILVIILIIEIIRIYAVFYSEASGNIEVKNANWQIYVNNVDITTGQVEEFTVDNLNIDDEEGVKEGNLAPGVSGDFTITIDPRNTDVSVEYDIEFQAEEMENKQIKIVSVEEINGQNTFEQTGENKYTGRILLSDIQNGATNTIKVKLEWEDDGTNDEMDSEYASIPDRKINLPVKVTVRQYL